MALPKQAANLSPDAPLNLSLLRRLNLNHLISFLAVAGSQSFRDAAGQLHLSQSALSVQIQQLEETLGVPLFHRTTRSVTPTEEGRQLLPVAQQLAREVTLVAGGFQEQAALQQGVATLGATPSITSFFVAPVLKALADDYPGIKVRVLVRESSKAVASMVRQGEADVGLLNVTQSLKDLQITRLLEDELVAVVSASDPRFAKSARTTLRELSRAPLLIQPIGSSTREVLEANLREQGVSVNVRYELQQPDVLVAFVQQGLGVVVLPRGVLAPLNLKGCRVLPLRTVISRVVGLITSTRRSVSPSAGLLRRYLVDASLPGKRDGS